MIWKRRNSVLEESNAISPFGRLLKARQIEDWEVYSSPLGLAQHSPFLMQDMSTAVDLLLSHLDKGSKILVFGDYDVDGTCSVALVMSVLNQVKANCVSYIPDRYEEGYGFSVNGAQWAIDHEVQLIITLDCGTKDGPRILKCRNAGIDVIVCDHHEPDILPAANAVLNPKRKDCEYPFKGLSGCGVGYKLMMACAERKGWPMSWILSTVDLVAVAACADIVPMVDENRNFVALGLQMMQQNMRPGLKGLIAFSGAKDRNWSVSDIVFLLAPRINAAGRIASGNAAVSLLLANDPSEVESIAGQIEEYNQSRRSIDQNVTAEALSVWEADPFNQEAFVNVLWNEHWLKGVIGIVASRVLEKHYRPTIVFTKSHEVWAGSARSIEGLDIYEALDACKEELIQFGGHTMAAGMSIKEDNLLTFREKFNRVVGEKLNHVRPEPVVLYDIEIKLSEVEMEWIKSLSGFAPCGPENMAPVFLIKGLRPAFPPRQIGADGKHLKCSFRQGIGGTYFDAIGFGMAESMEMILAGPVDVLCALEINVFNGRTSVQMNLKAIRPSQS
jgi:single-stranded-DNA-specific exonuclease